MWWTDSSVQPSSNCDTPDDREKPVPSDAIEAALLRRAREGDDDAFADLVGRLAAVALRLAAVLGGDRDEADDIVQDALVKAHAAMGGFRDGASVRPWLLTIVANEARNRRRGRSRRDRRDWRVAIRDGALAEPSAEVRVMERVTAQQLIESLGRLRTDDREVLSCRFLLDLDESTTAEVLGCAVGTVKSRTSRALSRLRAQVGPEWPERDRI